MRGQIISADVKKTVISDMWTNEQMQERRNVDRRMFNADKENMIAIENIQ